MTYNSLSTASPDSREMQANPNNSQVLFKTFEGKLLLLLPRETGKGDSEAIAAASWPEIWQQLKLRLNAGETFWEANTEVELVAFDRLLDTRQLQEIAKALSEAQLQLKLINTSRRQTAVAAATVGYSVQQGSAAIGQESNSQEKGKALAEPLYLKTDRKSVV